MNNKELVKAGHERAAELKDSFEAINACSVSQLISDLASQLEVQFARSNALAAKLSMINGLMDAAEQANKLAQEATEKLVQERDALAAENAGLIRSSEILLHEASEVYRAYNKTQLPDGDLVDEQSLQEVYDAINATPTTDAFLAEVRASAKADGVQEYADSFRHAASKHRELHGKTIRVKALLHEAENADKFSAQLRKGAAQ
ncbi:TPA: hypothetical protein ACIJTU_000645 [Citrobacter koseri]